MVINVVAHFFFTKFVNIIYYHYLCTKIEHLW